MNENRRIIFHIPWKIRENRPSASQIRPLKMLQAFRNCGYIVDTVMGSEEEKRKSIKEIRSNIRSGAAYAFCYSESSTGPNLIANGWKQILKNRNQDFRFFRLLKQNNIPIGLFYRDIYWRFYSGGDGNSAVRKRIMTMLYFFDLWNYRKYVSTLFLPSPGMQNYIPLYKGKFHALPPGGTIAPKASPAQAGQDSPGASLTLIYIGGVTGHYGLQELLNYLSTSPADIQCLICTRKNEWETLTASLPNPDQLKNNSLQVFHTSGEELDPLYLKAQIALIFVQPVEYRNFAMPFKLFEYIGRGLPVIASEGTAAADFIAAQDAGWVIPYNEKALSSLLNHLINNPQEVDKKRRNVLQIQKANTWEARAKEAAEELQPPGGTRQTPHLPV